MADLSKMTTEQLLAVYQQAKGGQKPPKLTTQEAQQLQQARADAEAARAAARDAGRFLEINQGTGTGEIWAWPFAGEVRGAFDPRYSEMQSLTNRMAPAQRQAGSGAMSDKDVALFKKSVPNTDFPGPVNTQIVSRIQADAKRRGDYAAFLDSYAQQRGTLLGAEAEWQRRLSAPKKPPPPKPTGEFKVLGVR